MNESLREKNGSYLVQCGGYWSAVDREINPCDNNRIWGVEIWVVQHEAFRSAVLYPRNGSVEMHRLV